VPVSQKLPASFNAWYENGTSHCTLVYIDGVVYCVCWGRLTGGGALDLRSRWPGSRLTGWQVTEWALDLPSYMITVPLYVTALRQIYLAENNPTSRIIINYVYLPNNIWQRKSTVAHLLALEPPVIIQGRYRKWRNRLLVVVFFQI